MTPKEADEMLGECSQVHTGQCTYLDVDARDPQPFRIALLWMRPIQLYQLQIVIGGRPDISTNIVSHI